MANELFSHVSVLEGDPNNSGMMNRSRAASLCPALLERRATQCAYTTGCEESEGLLAVGKCNATTSPAEGDELDATAQCTEGTSGPSKLGTTPDTSRFMVVWPWSTSTKTPPQAVQGWGRLFE